MLERLEQQKKLTANQWKIIATANLGDMLDFFDFFLIGSALAFNVAAILGRFFVTALIEPLGRRGSGILCCASAAVLMVLAGYLHDVYVGSVSLFFVLVMAQNFFGSANYSAAGPYMTEIWPTRLRASGMGLGYGVGNSGKIIGPLGLALILGANDLIKPAANVDALGLAFLYFASWYVLGIIAYWFIGFETKGRSFEEIDAALTGPPPVKTRAA